MKTKHKWHNLRAWCHIYSNFVTNHCAGVQHKQIKHRFNTNLEKKRFKAGEYIAW